MSSIVFRYDFMPCEASQPVLLAAMLRQRGKLGGVAACHIDELLRHDWPANLIAEAVRDSVVDGHVARKRGCVADRRPPAQTQP